MKNQSLENKRYKNHILSLFKNHFTDSLISLKWLLHQWDSFSPTDVSRTKAKLSAAYPST